jgi:hypothetical protein
MIEKQAFLRWKSHYLVGWLRVSITRCGIGVALIRSKSIV